ncbi:MAG: hypothetical protein DRP63_01825 [Planctomycetota bacterium]|nr:MAG: hypothetical protein DRP63_01825 [Planctomycetota bacterium]
MRWFALVAVFAVLGLLVGQDKTQPAAEKQPFTLQLKGKEGDEHFFRTKMVMNGTSMVGPTKLEQEFIWRIKVDKVAENGNIHSRWKALLIKAKQNVPMLGEGYFDSEKGEAKGITQGQVDMLNKLLERETKVEMTKTGKVVSGAIQDIPSLEFLPEKPVKVGDSWMVEQRKEQANMVFKYTLKEVRTVDGSKVAVIESELLKVKLNAPSPMKFDGKGRGTILFNIDKGMVMKNDMTMNLTIAMSNPQTGEEMKFSQNLKASGEMLKEKPKCTPKKVKLIGGGGAKVPVPVPPPPEKKSEPEKSK